MLDGGEKDEIGVRHVINGSAVTFGAQGGKFLIKIATQILIARLLLPEDYGLIAMITPITALLQLMGDLGLGQTAVIEKDISDAEVSALLWFGVALNLVLALALILLSPAIAWLYHNPRVLPITLVMAALLPVTGLAIQHIALLNRQLKLHALAALDIVPASAALIAGLAAAHAGWGYWSLVWAIIMETVTTTLLAWGLSRWRPDWPRRTPIRRLLRIGWHLTGTNLATYVTNSVDNVLLGTVQGDVALGLYNRGVRLITQPVVHLFTPATRIAVPLLTRLRTDPAQYRRVFIDILSLTVLAGTPAILFAMLMARPLVLLVLGPQWQALAPIFFWLGLGGIALPVYIAVGWLFITQWQTGRQMRFVTITSVIAVVSFIAGLPWGAVGVSACSGMATLLISTPLCCWGATRHSMVRLGDLVRGLVPLGIAALVTTAALCAVNHYSPPEGVLPLIATGLLSYAVFVATLCLTGWSIIRRAWHFGAVLRGADA